MQFREPEFFPHDAFGPTWGYFEWSDPRLPPRGSSAAAAGIWQLRTDTKEGSESTKYSSSLQKYCPVHKTKLS